MKNLILLTVLVLFGCSDPEIEPNHNQRCQTTDIRGKWHYVMYKTQLGSWQPSIAGDITINDSTIVCYTGIHVYPYLDLCFGNFIVSSQPYKIEIYGDTMKMIEMNTLTQYKLKKVYPVLIYNLSN